MGKIVQMAVDSFANLVARLNTSRDKQSAGAHYLLCLTDSQLSIIHRTSWMGRKCVDIPAEDATREWREWHAEQDQIEAIEAEERRLQLPQKTMLAVATARLFGGSAMYMSVRGDDPALPLEPATVKQNGIDFVTVLSKGALTAGDIQWDPLLPGYGRPKDYSVTGSAGTQTIHPSRLAIFLGREILNANQSFVQNQGWGDSVLQSAYEAVRNADSSLTNTAGLVYEAKIDVLQIPNLMHIMNDPTRRDDLVKRVELAAQLKGNNGMLVIDGEEDYSQKTFNFAGLPDINSQALQAVAGASDIPITRFLGQTPSGINSTGESDLKNYYDSVRSLQERVLSPSMFNLDEAIIYSALGERPPEIFYEWSSLWQMSDEQRSKIGKETAETIDILAKTALFEDDTLAEASVNLLNERGIMPGLELREDAGVEEDLPALGGEVEQE